MVPMLRGRFMQAGSHSCYALHNRVDYTALSTNSTGPDISVRTCIAFREDGSRPKAGIDGPHQGRS